jgi:hypothetical protein
MPKKVPVILYVDPEVESQFTIKPFAAGLAIKPHAAPSAQLLPEGMTSTASFTNANNSVDQDMDLD